MQSKFTRKALGALLTPLALAGAVALASPAQAAPVIGAATPADTAAASAVQSIDWHGYHRHCSWHHHHRHCW